MLKSYLPHPKKFNFLNDILSRALEITAALPSPPSSKKGASGTRPVPQLTTRELLCLLVIETHVSADMTCLRGELKGVHFKSQTLFQTSSEQQQPVAPAVCPLMYGKESKPGVATRQKNF